MNRLPRDNETLRGVVLDDSPTIRAVLKGLYYSVMARKEGKRGYTEEEARAHAREWLEPMPDNVVEVDFNPKPPDDLVA